MTKQIITLCAGGFATFDDREDILLPDTLYLTVRAAPFGVHDIIVTCHANGEEKKIRTCTGSEFSIVPTGAGEIRLTIHQILRGKVVRSWACEPLIVKESTDAGQIVIPALESMREEIDTLKKAIAELVEIKNKNIF